MNTDKAMFLSLSALHVCETWDRGTMNIFLEIQWCLGGEAFFLFQTFHRNIASFLQAVVSAWEFFGLFPLLAILLSPTNFWLILISLISDGNRRFLKRVSENTWNMPIFRGNFI